MSNIPKPSLKTSFTQNIVHSKQLEDEIDGERSVNSLSNYAFCLWSLGDIEQSKLEFSNAFQKAKDVESKVAILANEIFLYHEVKKPELCRARVIQLERMLESKEIQEVVDILHSNIHLASYYMNNDMDKADCYLKDVLRCFKDNRGNMTQEMGNSILDFQGKILALQMSILVRKITCSSLSKDFDPQENVQKCDTLSKKDMHEMEQIFNEWREFNRLSKDTIHTIVAGPILDLSAAFSNAALILSNQQDFVQKPQKAFEYSNNALELQRSCNSYSSVTFLNRAQMYHSLALRGSDVDHYYDKAKEYFQRTLEKGDVAHETKALIYKKMAEINENIGLNSEAINDFQTSRNLYEKFNADEVENIQVALQKIIKKEVKEQYTQRIIKKKKKKVTRPKILAELNKLLLNIDKKTLIALNQTLARQ